MDEVRETLTVQLKTSTAATASSITAGEGKTSLKKAIATKSPAQQTPAEPSQKLAVREEAKNDAPAQAASQSAVNNELHTNLGKRAKSTTAKTYQELYDAASLAHKEYAGAKRRAKQLRKDWHEAIRVVNCVFHEPVSDSE